VLLERDRRLHTALLWHPEGEMAATVIDLVEPGEIITATSIGTRYKNGDVLITSSERKIFDLPEKWKGESLLKASPKELVTRHKERMETEPGTIRKYIRDEGPERSLAFEEELLEYLLERGILIELDQETVEDLWAERQNG
jgi:hypothetical protein